MLTILAGLGPQAQTGAARGGQDLSARTDDDLAAAGTSRQRATHLLQLGARSHLLGEQRGLDAVEHTFQPADELGLRDAQLGLGWARRLTERAG